MKIIENKKVKLFGNDISYAFLMKTCLDAIPNTGILASEMRKRLRVHVAIESNSEKIELEDADHETLVACAKQTYWKVVDQVIIDFEEALGIEK